MDEAILAKEPTVTLNGNLYTMRRIGILDAFTFADMLGSSASTLVAALSKGTPGDATETGMALFAAVIEALPKAQKPILDFLADILQIKPEDIRNPNLFPLQSITELIKALAAHPDMKEFLEQLRPLVFRVRADQPNPTLTDSPSN